MQTLVAAIRALVTSAASVGYFATVDEASCGKLKSEASVFLFRRTHNNSSLSEMHRRCS